MADPTMQAFQARLDLQAAELTTLRATVHRHERQTRRGRSSRRSLPLAVVALLVALLPLSLLAANPTFSDLNDAAEVHRPNIRAIGDAGITTGFEDPNNPNARLYTPKGNVTREEMASFLARTAGLGGNPPVANAKTAQTADQATSAISATNAQNAGNANTVGGYAPDGLARTVGIISGRTLTLSTSPQEYDATVALDAPGSGFVLLFATVELERSAGCPCEIFVSARQTNPAPQPPLGASVAQVGMASGSPRLAVPVNYLFPALPGEHTYRLSLYRVGTGTVTVVGGTIFALYVPFDGTGQPYRP